MYQQFRCSQIMLPEHCRELEKHRLSKDQYLQARQPPDEQEKEKWDSLLQASRRTGQQINIAFLSSSPGQNESPGRPGHRPHIRTITGSVEKICPSSGCLFLNTGEKTVKIPARKIILVSENEM